MRLLLHLQALAFVAALAQASAIAPRDNVAAAAVERDAQPTNPALLKRLFGFCIPGFEFLGDCHTSPVRPRPTSTAVPTAVPTVNGNGTATGNQTASPTTPPSTDSPAPTTIDRYAFTYSQPPLPRQSARINDDSFNPSGGVIISSFARTRRYTFNIGYARGGPDGFQRRMIVINGQYPGPLIEGNQGDTIQVQVNNQLDIGQSLHWHGMRQNGSFWADGIPGVSQCPIPPGQSFTYEFKLDSEYGTYWYHSHFGNTLADGAVGPLVVHSNKEPIRQGRGYDDERIVMLSDWNDNQSGIILHALHDKNTTYRGSAVMGPPDALLINGLGQTDCSVAQKGVQCTQQNQAKIKVTYGRKTRIRIINSGAEAMIRYSIDQHEMTVIEIDDTPVEPFTVHEIPVWPGQRYSVIITARQGLVGSTFYMRGQMASGCLVPNPLMTVKAQLQYTDWLGLTWLPRTPRDNPWGDLADPINELCHDIDHYHPNIKPSVVEDPPADVKGVDIFDSSFGEFIDPNTNKAYIGFGINGVEFLNTIYNPLGKQIMDGRELDGEKVASVTWREQGAYDLIINQHDPNPLAHPFHLHGRPFHIIARGDGAITKEQYAALPKKTTGALRRDTFSIPGSSYAVIRLITDNPGVWALHCHIGWHLGVGKLAAVVVRPDDFRKQPQPGAWLGLCAGQDPNHIGFERRDEVDAVEVVEPIVRRARRQDAQRAKRKL